MQVGAVLTCIVSIMKKGFFTMNVLSHLEPKAVFRFFEEICAIPHGSFETKAISDYLVEFAKARGLSYRQEPCNNVIIWKDATVGYENAPTVMLQGHMDMVCEQDSDCTKDMSKEGLDLFVDGDVIGAKGTTLGGDDGIALAMALAILDADDIPHGPLECLFTVDEEVGMGGARALDASDLKARYLLNLDSEAEKVLTVSCAGTIRAVCTFPVRREAFGGDCFTLTVTGLMGGHSGEEIHLGRANANILLGRALTQIAKVCPMRLVSVTGGAKDNAIPREATAAIVVQDAAAARKAVQELEEKLRFEYFSTDAGVRVLLNPAEAALLPMDKRTTDTAACFLFCVPNGVQNMSAEVPGLVQTSLNLGRVYMEDDSILFSLMLRSSVNSQNWEVYDKVYTLCAMLGGKTNVSTSYCAWEYQPESALRDIMIEAFRAVYNEEPKIAALHAGLECGILSGKLPGLDCISFGPDLTDIHTPRERLHIASTERTWLLTLETLKRLK